MRRSQLGWPDYTPRRTSSNGRRSLPTHATLKKDREGLDRLYFAASQDAFKRVAALLEAARARRLKLHHLIRTKLLWANEWTIKERSARERAQHLAETARLKTTIDNLSQKLERQTSDQMGEMGEAEVYTALKAAFPTDDIQRIGKGVCGADILHKVIVNGKEVGCIVYECKNVASWQNEWIAKAKRYRSEYQTPWVIIAARTFPRRQKWFVVEKTVPVIDFRLTVKLAEIVRSAITEIGQLRTSRVGRQTKADQMFEYILSDHFVVRFKGVAEAVVALRDHQRKEKQWHNEAWAKQNRLYHDMEQGHDEINAQIRTISETTSKLRLKVVGEG